MNGLMLGLTITVGVLITLGLVFGIVFLILWPRLKHIGSDRIQEKFPTERILRSETTANFFGLQSRGRSQIRGNGVLVLTPYELWFSRFVKRDDITIPLSKIITVELVNSHLGKRILGKQLLYVKFHSDVQAEIDEVAWLVADPNAWKTAIQTAQS